MASVSVHPLIVASLPESAQMIILRPQVIEHMAGHKQNRFWKSEAGGQLFAQLSDSCLDVVLATGPYRGDIRSRFGFRSDPKRAQREITRQRELGLYYCGDWHTHPQSVPAASPEDYETIAKLWTRSDLRLGTVLMVIQGTDDAVPGLAVYSTQGTETTRWQVGTAQIP